MSSGRLEELDLEACLVLLRAESIGRIAVIVDETPIVLPVNYRLVEANGITWVAVRTRPGNVVDRTPMFVALEIDEIDAGSHQGWSVLVRGTLQRVDPDAADFRARFDSQPWLTDDRERWLIIEPFAITGRRLHSPTTGWDFQPGAYL